MQAAPPPLPTDPQAPPTVPDEREVLREEIRGELREAGVHRFVVARVQRADKRDYLAIVRLPRASRRAPRRAVHIPRPVHEHVDLIGKRSHVPDTRGSTGTGRKPATLKLDVLRWRTRQGR